MSENKSLSYLISSHNYRLTLSPLHKYLLDVSFTGELTNWPTNPEESLLNKSFISIALEVYFELKVNNYIH